MKSIQIAQFGVGYWGPNITRNLLACEGVEKIVVCDTSMERLERIKNLYNGKIEIETDEAAILSDPAISAVVITLPASLHFEYVRKALHAGKHVLVEKPLASTVEESEELVALAKEKKCVLMVGHTFLYNEAVRQIKHSIDKGELGDIYYIFSQRLNLGRVRDDINVLWNLAPHDVSIILYWLGENPNRVQGKGLTFLQDGIEDVAFVNLDFPSGRSAHMHVSWLDPSKTRKMVVVGSKKMLVYDDVSSDAKIMIYDKGIDKKHIVRDLPDIESFGHFQLLQRSGDVVIPKIPFTEPLKTECAHFIDCVMHNKQPLTDGVHGVEVVRVLEEAQRSMVESRQ